MIRFKMLRIVTEQFAILRDVLPSNDISVDSNIGIKYAENGKNVVIELAISYTSGQEQVMLLKVSCTFAIHEEDWKSLVSEGKVVVPKNVIDYFLSQTVGTARGILHCKTEGTIFNSLILPSMNVSEILKEDMVIEIED